MKKVFCSWFIPFVAGFVLNAPVWAGFEVDLIAPALTSTFYSAPTNNTLHTINADYARNAPAPYDMIVPTLSSGNTLRIRVLLPPGTKQAVIRGESNDWIGATGKQPVVGVIPQEITGACPFTSDGISYACSGVMLQPPAGGLSMPLYAGTVLTTPTYVNFVLHNPSGSFSFSSLSIAIQINDVAAYKAWRDARPWAGGAASNSVDGITATNSTNSTTTPTSTTTGTSGIIATPTGCPTGSALMPTLSTDLTLTIPRLKYLPGGFPGDMKVVLKPVRDPNDSSQIVFELMSLGSPDFYWLPCQ